MPYLTYTIMFMGTIFFAIILMRASKGNRLALQPVRIEEDPEEQLLKKED